MKILVTGAAGFIGFHLTVRLIEAGHTVVGIDNLNDYYDVRLKLARLKKLRVDTYEIAMGKKMLHSTNVNFKFIKMDLKEIATLADLFKEEKFDVVCNLAAQAGVRYSIDNPSTYIESNIVGFANILECCRHNDIKHLVYASSSSVYGMNKKIPFSTTDMVDYPVSLYAATKRSNELMAYTYSHLYDIPITGLRFFTVYGPWGRPDMAYYLFTKAILENKPIKVFNRGDMNRDFTYIDDIVEGIERVLNYPPQEISTPYSRSKAKHKIYNIGNNTPVNLLFFIETIEQILGKTANKQFLPMQLGDVPTTYADSSHLIEDLGYKPNTDLKTGIQNFINWYLEYNPLKEDLKK